MTLGFPHEVYSLLVERIGSVASTISFVALVLLFLLVGSYNKLVRGRNRVYNAWSQIDVQLKRRHDLVPNLVNAVRGYMTHEQTIFETVTRARQMAITAGNQMDQRVTAENMLTQEVRSLFAVAEAYPVLKADSTMRALQEELSSTENRIAYARQFYNDAVMEYNTSCETFPDSIAAGLFGFHQENLFQLYMPQERQVPLVQL
jgi:LemA protein